MVVEVTDGNLALLSCQETVTVIFTGSLAEVVTNLTVRRNNCGPTVGRGGSATTTVKPL